MLVDGEEESEGEGGTQAGGLTSGTQHVLLPGYLQ